MVACVMCLEMQSNVTPHDYIELFSEHGLCLKICDIISKHFWLRPKKELCPGVCKACWESVRDFHQFYQRVAEAHNYLESKEMVGVVVEDDPLPHEVLLKSEEVGSAGQLNDALSNNFFDSEVKVEVHDLDLLPQVEIIENAANISGRAQRARRRRRSANDEMAEKSILTPKRIKEENSPMVDTLTDEQELELPLSELMQVELKTDADADPTETSEYLKTNVKTAKCVFEMRKRRRGRPKKVETESTGTGTAESKSNNYNSDEVVELKKTDSESDADDGREYLAAAFSSSNEDSIKAGSDEENSDSDFRSSKLKERYAVIPKRIVVRPKKYCKREKPAVAPRRMTREEIDRRNAQQAEYDKIIIKFFDKFQCPKCELLVKNFGEMRQHFRVSHNDDHGYMMCCGRKFQLRKTLAEHIYLHWNPEHFKCSTCGLVFQDSRHLDTHEQSHTNPQQLKEKKMFPCNKCPKVLSTKASLEDHVSSKHIPKSEFKFECTECTKKFPTQRKLKDHMKIKHDPESAVICDKCGKRMQSQYSLKKHHELEHSGRPRPEPVLVQCEICGVWLRSGLKRHMKSIHEEAGGDYRCHICNKKSTNARALKRHIYHNHECERKFKCTMCEKAFKRGQDLREHTSTHTGEVLYTCPNCQMTFFSVANMYKHRQRLHRAEYEADKKNPNPPNIMRQAKDASAALKMQRAVGAASSFFAQKQATTQIPFTTTTDSLKTIN